MKSKHSQVTSIQVGEFTVRAQYYWNKNRAIAIMKNGLPYATLSINLNNDMEDDKFVLNHDVVRYPAAAHLLQSLLDSGHFITTGEEMRFGSHKTPVWQYIE